MAENVNVNLDELLVNLKNIPEIIQTKLDKFGTDVISKLSKIELKTQKIKLPVLEESLLIEKQFDTISDAFLIFGQNIPKKYIYIIGVTVLIIVSYYFYKWYSTKYKANKDNNPVYEDDSDEESDSDCKKKTKQAKRYPNINKQTEDNEKNVTWQQVQRVPDQSQQSQESHQNNKENQDNHEN
jgi:hypothetical protein